MKTRVTFNGGSLPVWASDGQRILFARGLGADRRWLQRFASGGGTEESLLQAAGDLNSVSPDGQWIASTTIDATTGRDVKAIALDGHAIAVAQTPFNETHPQFSPDGNWIAYVSDEASGARGRTNEENGRTDVYVQSFPTPNVKVRVSANGGDLPRWRRDGKELFYLGPDDAMMSVAVQPGQPLAFGLPQKLFDTRVITGAGLGTRSKYDVTADGQRFIVLEKALAPSSSPITVILNWPEELKAHVPPK
jgi:eukaryotic-like serine/threonine-protein kinase